MYVVKKLLGNAEVQWVGEDFSTADFEVVTHI